MHIWRKKNVFGKKFKILITTYNVGLPLNFLLSLHISSMRMASDMAKYVNKYSSIKSSILQLQYNSA